MAKIDVPTKAERDDGGSNDIGYFGFIFAAVLWCFMVYTFIVEVIF